MSRDFLEDRTNLGITEFVWAPDGRSVYVGGYEPSGIPSIWRVDITSARELGELTQLTSGPAQARHFTLSRDGRRLVFTAQVDQVRIWSFPLDEPRHTISHERGRPLTDADELPLYIAGSSSIATPGAKFGLALLPLPTDESIATPRTLISDASFNFWQPHYSPDGRWLAFVAQQADGAGRLAVTSPLGGRWWTVTEVNADKPRWARDGRFIYFVSSALSGVNDVWAVPFDLAHGTASGAPIPVTRFDGTRWNIVRNPITEEMSVGRGALVLPVHDTSGNIWMLDNVDR